MNSKWTNQRPTSLCQPTIPVCTSAVADTACLAASPCRSKCCTAELQHGATTPQIYSRHGDTSDNHSQWETRQRMQRHWLKKYYRIVQVCTDMYSAHKMISNDCVNQLCHSEALVGLRWAARAHDDVLGVDNSTTPPPKTGSVHGLRWSTGKSWHLCHDIPVTLLTPWDPYSYVGDMCGSLEVSPGNDFQWSDVWRVCSILSLWTYTATGGQKKQKRTGEIWRNVDFSRFLLKLKICRDCRDVEWSRWSRPDKLRQLGSDCPSFEEVDSAVKRLETQRLNLNCLGNGCNIETNRNTRKPPGKDWKLHESASLDLRLQWNLQWNLQCGIMWNQYEPQQEYVLLRGLSAICWTTCPMHFQLRLRALALRRSKAKQGELGIAFKENDQKKNLSHKWETLCYGEFGIFVWRVSSVCSSDGRWRALHAQCWAATCTMGATWIIREYLSQMNGTANWEIFGDQWIHQMNHTHNWDEFLQCQFWNDLPFSVAIFGAANCNKSQRRANWESSVRVPQILNKWIRIISATSCQSPQTQMHQQTDRKMYDVWSHNIQLLGRSSEGFTLVRFSELVGPARGISRVWFPKYKDSQSIPSKVLPNLGIPKHGIAWKKITGNARSASTATGATLFSQPRATVAGCGDQTANGVLSNSRVWVFACLWRTTL